MDANTPSNIPGPGWGNGASTIARGFEQIIISTPLDLGPLKEMFGANYTWGVDFRAYSVSHFMPMFVVSGLIVGCGVIFILVAAGLLVYWWYKSTRQKPGKRKKPPVLCTTNYLRVIFVAILCLCVCSFIFSILGLWANSGMSNFYDLAGNIQDTAKTRLDTLRAETVSDLQALLRSFNQTVQMSTVDLNAFGATRLADKVRESLSEVVVDFNTTVMDSKDLGPEAAASVNAIEEVVRNAAGTLGQLQSRADKCRQLTNTLVSLCQSVATPASVNVTITNPQNTENPTNSTQITGDTTATATSICENLRLIVSEIDTVSPQIASNGNQSVAGLLNALVDASKFLKSSSSELVNEFQNSEMYGLYNDFSAFFARETQFLVSEMTKHLKGVHLNGTEELDAVISGLNEMYGNLTQKWDFGLGIIRVAVEAHKGNNSVEADVALTDKYSWSMRILLEYSRNEGTRYAAFLTVFLLSIGALLWVVMATVGTWYIYERDKAYPTLLIGRDATMQRRVNLQHGQLWVVAGIAMCLGLCFLTFVAWSTGYAVGQTTQQVCEPLETYRYLAEVLDNPEIMGGYPLAALLHGNETFPLTYSSVLGSCMDNVPTWKAVRMYRKMNLSTLLSPSANLGNNLFMQIDDLIDAMDIPVFPMDPKMNSTLHDMSDVVNGISPSTIDWIGKLMGRSDKFDWASNQRMVQMSVGWYQLMCAKTPNCTAQDISNFTTTAQELGGLMDKLGYFLDSDVVPVQLDLQRATEEAQSVQASTNRVITLWTTLYTRQPRVIDEATQSIKSIARTDLKQYLTPIDEFSLDAEGQVLSKIGRCRPLWLAVSEPVDVLCGYMRTRAEALWFACAALSIVLIPTVVMLLLSLHALKSVQTVAKIKLHRVFTVTQSDGNMNLMPGRRSSAGPLIDTVTTESFPLVSPNLSVRSDKPEHDQTTPSAKHKFVESETTEPEQPSRRASPSEKGLKLAAEILERERELAVAKARESNRDADRKRGSNQSKEAIEMETEERNLGTLADLPHRSEGGAKGGRDSPTQSQVNVNQLPYNAWDMSYGGSMEELSTAAALAFGSSAGNQAAKEHENASNSAANKAGRTDSSVVVYPVGYSTSRAGTSSQSTVASGDGYTNRNARNSNVNGSGPVSAAARQQTVVVDMNVPSAVTYRTINSNSDNLFPGYVQPPTGSHDDTHLLIPTANTTNAGVPPQHHSKTSVHSSQTEGNVGTEKRKRKDSQKHAVVGRRNSESSNSRRLPIESAASGVFEQGNGSSSAKLTRRQTHENSPTAGLGRMKSGSGGGSHSPWVTNGSTTQISQAVSSKSSDGGNSKQIRRNSSSNTPNVKTVELSSTGIPLVGGMGGNMNNVIQISGPPARNRPIGNQYAGGLDVVIGGGVSKNAAVPDSVIYGLSSSQVPDLLSNRSMQGQSQINRRGSTSSLQHSGRV